MVRPRTPAGCRHPRRGDRRTTWDSLRAEGVEDPDDSIPRPADSRPPGPVDDLTIDTKGTVMKTIARCSSLLAISAITVCGVAGLAGCEDEEVVDVTPRQVDENAPKIDPNAMPGGGGMEAQGS